MLETEFKALHKKMDMVIAAVEAAGIKVTYEKPDGVHYSTDLASSPLYKPDPSKPYFLLVNQMGGANRLAIRIEGDAAFWANKLEAIAFKEDWPYYFAKEWREKWYGPDFVWEDLVERK